MFRKNPDAVAVCVIGLFLLVASVPRFMVQQSRWRVTPLRMEMQIPKEDLRELRDQLRSQREVIRDSAECLRKSIHEQ